MQKALEINLQNKFLTALKSGKESERSQKSARLAKSPQRQPVHPDITRKSQLLLAQMKIGLDNRVRKDFAKFKIEDQIMKTTAGQKKGVPEYRYQKYRSIIAKPSFTNNELSNELSTEKLFGKWKVLSNKIKIIKKSLF